MGKLLPRNGNATHSSAGQLSPLFEGPDIAHHQHSTRIFLGGGKGYVSWEGTQFKTNVPTKNGVPTMAARALAVIGDLRGMSPEYLRALYFTKYGVPLGVGIGVPIPILDESLMRSVARTDEEIFAPVLDYGVQSRNRRSIKEVSYGELRRGTIEINGKEVRTSSLSSYRKARDIAATLRDWIRKGEFLLTKPVELMPDERIQKTLDAHANWELV